MFINYSTSSGQKTTSTQISTMCGALSGVDLAGPDVGQAVLTIYDSENSTTSGKVILCEVFCDAGMMSVNHEFFMPVAVNRGIYALLTLTGGAAGSSSFIVRFTV